MELRQLQYLEAVVRHGGFTRGAEELHVAQSAVSAQIKRLESELGVRLLERTTRSVQLTRAGEVVLARARRVLSELDGIRADAAELSGGLSGRVRIGAIAAIERFDLAAALAAFTVRYPRVELALTSGWLRELVADLEAHRLHLAIGALDALPGHVTGTPIYADEIVLITSARHPTATEGDLGLAAVQGEAFACLPATTGLRRILDRACAEAGFAPDVRYETTSVYQLRELVSHGFGVALVVRSVAEAPGRPVAVHRLLPVPIEQPIGLLRLRDWPLDAAAARCQDFLLAWHARPVLPPR